MNTVRCSAHALSRRARDLPGGLTVTIRSLLFAPEDGYSRRWQDRAALMMQYPQSRETGASRHCEGHYVKRGYVPAMTFYDWLPRL